MWRWLLPVAVACVAAYVLVRTSQHTLHPHRTQRPAAQVLGVDFPCIGSKSPPPTTYKHVVWILFGERGYSSVIGKYTKATYANELAGQCGLATKYSSVTHPALPNLVAIFSGQTAGFTKNRCDPCQTGVRSLFSQVPSWGVYMQSMPTNCRTANTPGGYVTHSNPALFFRGVRCALHRPAGQGADARYSAGADGDRPEYVPQHELQPWMRTRPNWDLRPAG
jgi:phosphatidylinositol-3-phosphatase